MQGSTIRTMALALAGVSLAGLATPLASQAQAQAAARRDFNIPAQDMAGALEAFGRQSGRDILFDRSQVSGRLSSALQGTFEPGDALRRLVAGTGMAVSAPNAGTFVVGRGSGEAEAGSVAAEDVSANAETITVTGTRVRNATIASPLIRLSGEEMRDSGYRSIADAVRDLPQNFSGGQNPGVTQGAAAGGNRNQNINSATNINLRGLGQDATLTLLNGRRLSYGSFTQGVDISSIPLGLVDRIEIVPDGGSAIYGSDAVAGVVNIILKGEYEGVTPRARLSLAEDGGGASQEYGLIGGINWNNGGLVVGIEQELRNRVLSSDRGYTSYMPDGNTLFPEIDRFSSLATAHHEITDLVSVGADFLYSIRDAEVVTATTTSFTPNETTTEALAFAAWVETRPFAEWTAQLSGGVSSDDTTYAISTFARPNRFVSVSTGCYCNNSQFLEFIAEGSVVRLPGGDVRTAIGGGYRRSSYFQRSVAGNGVLSTVQASQSNLYAFGEIDVPLVSARNSLPAVTELRLNGSLRYENYQRASAILTPRVGVIWSPQPWLSVRGSWGRSFKTPTLQEQFSPLFVTLFPAALLAATGYPPSATALVANGGNRDLTPERAETLALTTSVRPFASERTVLEASYFDIDYTDRIGRPIPLLNAIFNNSANLEFIQFDPTVAEQQALIDSARGGLTLFGGTPYNPANVIAIVDNTSLNIASQRIRGVDLSASHIQATSFGQFSFSARASWLRIRQRLTSLAAELPVTGIVYNAPRFRARGGLTWRNGTWLAGAFINHIDGVRSAPNATMLFRGEAMTTLDLNLSFRGERSNWYRSFEIGIFARNALNTRPPFFPNATTSIVNYDSTNYSALGRVIGFDVAITF